VTVVLDEGADRPEVGFAVGRSVGPAVVRNRIRRRLRAAMAELAPLPGTYLVAAVPAAAAAPFAVLRDDLAAALDEVGARQQAGRA
jgi:ribonuclease P protein component